MAAAKNIDAYIRTFPKDVQAILKKLRQLIKAEAPGAQEDIRYGIPTFRLKEKNLVHFGGWKQHVALYPTPSGTMTFKKELAPYESGKGSITFPIDKPIPFGLIRKIVKFRVREIKGGERKGY